MPAVACPIPGCNYVTDDLGDVVVAALIKVHAKTHATPQHKLHHTPSCTVSQSDDDLSTDRASKRQKEDVTEFGALDEDAARDLRQQIHFYSYTVGKTGRFSIFGVLTYIVQLLKVIIVTYQVVQFGKTRNEFIDLVNNDHVVLRHLFLKDWDASWETPRYPPAHGEFASYKIDDLSERINQSVYNYYHIEDLTLGLFKRLPDKEMMVTFELFHIGASGFDKEKVTFPIQGGVFDFIEEIRNRSRNATTTRMDTLTLDFYLQSKSIIEGDTSITCLDSDGKITFKNEATGGMVNISTKTMTKRVRCNETTVNDTGHVQEADVELRWASKTVTGLAILLGLLSLILYSSFALYGLYICRKTKQFMKKNYRAFYKPPKNDKSTKKEETNLHWKEYLHFFRYWTLIYIVADILMIYSSAEHLNMPEEYDAGYLDRLAVSLGACVLLQWVSILPLLCFHHMFAMLMRTINRAFFKVLLFIFSAAVVFVGFILCGMLVLGPYHVKFRKISSVAETLFAMANGDEMYSTLHQLDLIGESSAYKLLWYFTRVYFPACIAVFTIVVLNISLAIVLGAYDASLKYYQEKENMANTTPLETAMYRVVVNSKHNSFRRAIIQFMTTDAIESNDEQLIRDHFRKFCRVTGDGRDIESFKPRTIKAFMDEGVEDKMGTCKHCGIQCLYHPCNFCKQ